MCKHVHYLAEVNDGLAGGASGAIVDRVLAEKLVVATLRTKSM